MSSSTKLVSQTIEQRKTTKLLADIHSPISYSHDDLNRVTAHVDQAIKDAGMAPFHYDRGVDGLAEPWRFYVLRQDDCRRLSVKLAEWFPKMKASAKLPAMLAACANLVLITWIPQFEGLVWLPQEEGTTDAKRIQIDEEHLAATAAATQNFLLSLTASGLLTYWSSGGFFRTKKCMEKLSIPTNQRLLSAIFISPEAVGNAEAVAGKLRDKRSLPEQWTMTLSLRD
ncbi:MAG: nitroreductase family protein [Planctomycetota bacterium]